jgi:hypothetical protein
MAKKSGAYKFEKRRKELEKKKRKEEKRARRLEKKNADHPSESDPGARDASNEGDI